MRRPNPLSLLLMSAAFTIPAQAPQRDPHEQFTAKLVAAAIERTHHVVRYDPA
jgi:hypothetical protein